MNKCVETGVFALDTALLRPIIGWQVPSAGRLAAPFDRPRIFKSSHSHRVKDPDKGNWGRRAMGDREENVSVDRRCNQEEDH